MKLSKYIWLVALGGVTVLLAFCIVLLSAINDRTQQNLQSQQLAINNGVLGPQGQQISAAILQDMANASANNRAMRTLLRKYGYTVQSGVATAAPATGAAVNATTKENDEVGNE